MSPIRPDTIVINWLLTLPFFAAAFALIFPRLNLQAHSPKEAEGLKRGPYLLGALASAMGAILAGSLLPIVSRSGPVTADYWWTQNLYHLRFQADILGISAALVLSLLGVVGHLLMAGLLNPANANRKSAAALAMQGAGVAACLSADLILLVFCLQLMMALWWLLTPDRERKNANVMLSMTSVGGLMLLAGVLLMWQRTGDTSLDQLGLLLIPAEPQELQVIAILIAIGFLPLLAAWPGHGWLWSTAQDATELAWMGAFLLPVTAGVGLVRLLPGAIVLPLLSSLGVMTLLLGLGTLWWGAVKAWLARDLLGLSVWFTVAHGGFFLLALGAMASPTAPISIARAASLHLVATPLALAGIWVGYGAWQAGRRRAALTVAALALGGLSVAGLPPLPGFHLQRLLVGGLLQEGKLWLVVAMLGGNLLLLAGLIEGLRKLKNSESTTGEHRYQSALTVSLTLAVVFMIAASLLWGPLLEWTELVARAAFTISRGSFGAIP